MLTLMESVGERLKRARELAGLSQEQLAKDIGITRSAIAQVELGISTSMNAENLARAAKRLGREAIWLATGEGEEFDLDSITQATQNMPLRARRETIEYIMFQIQTNVVPYLSEPAAAHYTEMIERLKKDRDRLREEEKKHER